jgi:hypothetical protein
MGSVKNANNAHSLVQGILPGDRRFGECTAHSLSCSMKMVYRTVIIHLQGGCVCLQEIEQVLPVSGP